MLVKEIMTKDPACCTPETDLTTVAQLMRDNDCGCIPVVNSEKDRKPIGMITDRDITVRTTAEGKNALDLTARDAMTHSAVTATDAMSIDDCCNLMENNQIRRIAVVDADGSCCGMVAQADIAINAGNSKTAEVVQEVSRSAAA